MTEAEHSDDRARACAWVLPSPLDTLDGVITLRILTLADRRAPQPRQLTESDEMAAMIGLRLITKHPHYVYDVAKRPHESHVDYRSSGRARELLAAMRACMTADPDAAGR